MSVDLIRLCIKCGDEGLVRVDGVRVMRPAKLVPPNYVLWAHERCPVKLSPMEQAIAQGAPVG